jgi:hypothetical protein
MSEPLVRHLQSDPLPYQDNGCFIGQLIDNGMIGYCDPRVQASLCTAEKVPTLLRIRQSSNDNISLCLKISMHAYSTFSEHVGNVLRFKQISLVLYALGNDSSRAPDFACGNINGQPY